LGEWWGAQLTNFHPVEICDSPSPALAAAHPPMLLLPWLVGLQAVKAGDAEADSVPADGLPGEALVLQLALPLPGTSTVH